MVVHDMFHCVYTPCINVYIYNMYKVTKEEHKTAYGKKTNKNEKRQKKIKEIKEKEKNKLKNIFKKRNRKRRN